MVVAVVVFVLPELVALPVLLEVIPDVSDVTEAVSEEAVVFATSIWYLERTGQSLSFDHIQSMCQVRQQNKHMQKFVVFS